MYLIATTAVEEGGKLNIMVSIEFFML